MTEKNKPHKFPSYKPLLAMICLSPFMIGLYYEWLSCIASLFLIVYLIYCRYVAKRIYLPQTPVMVACSVIVGFFIISPIWAVDKGMSIFGAVKFLPLPLFCVALAQINGKDKSKLLETVPLVGAAMTLLSFPLSFIPALSRYFLVGERLAGFFQYSNTYAIYLLIGLVTIVLGNRQLKVQLVVSVILIFGIVTSGSRTVFILLAICAATYVIFSKNKKLKLSMLGVFIAVIVLATFYAIATDDLSTIGRFLTSSLTSSTFIGRILYYKDAIPVIIRHPFGLGYMGYYFLQGSFKTGVYTVMNVHNEFLQILLDIGWIPFAVCMWAAVHAVLRGNTQSKAIIIILLLHCMLDFDLQYIAVCFVLVLAMSRENEPKMIIKLKGLTFSFGVILAACSCYFGTAAFAYYFNDYDLSAKIYPAYTSAYIEKISDAESIEEMDKLADIIFNYNDSVSIAHSIKGRAAFAHGDVLDMIKYMKSAIALSRYRIDEYADYREMLKYAVEQFEKNEDTYSAEYCRDRIAEIPMMLKAVDNDTSRLAWKIDVKPILELDEY